MLCGGNHRGQRLSALPQPSRRPIASGLRESDSLPCADYGGGDLGSTWADLVSARFWHCRQPVVGLPQHAVWPRCSLRLIRCSPICFEWRREVGALSIIDDQDTLSRIRPD